MPRDRQPRDRQPRDLSPEFCIKYPGRSPSPPSFRSRSSRRRCSRSSSRSSYYYSPPPTRHRDRRGSKSGKDVTKTTLAFLGAVGVAAYVAHKLWPGENTHSDRKQWDAADVVRHAKRKAKNASGKGASRRRSLSTHDDGNSIRAAQARRHSARSELDDVSHRLRNRDAEEVEIVQRHTRVHRGAADQATVGSAAARQHEDGRRARHAERARAEQAAANTIVNTTAATVGGSRDGDTRRKRTVQEERRARR